MTGISAPPPSCAATRSAAGGGGRKATIKRKVRAKLSDLLTRRLRASETIMAILLGPRRRTWNGRCEVWSPRAAHAPRGLRGATADFRGRQDGETLSSIGAAAPSGDGRADSAFLLDRLIENWNFVLKRTGNGKARRDSMTGAPPLSRFFTPRAGPAQPIAWM